MSLSPGEIESVHILWHQILQSWCATPIDQIVESAGLEVADIFDHPLRVEMRSDEIAYTLISATGWEMDLSFGGRSWFEPEHTPVVTDIRGDIDALRADLIVLMLKNS